MRITLTPHAYPGRLIVFEGTDGAGKTTLIARTAAYLEAKCASTPLLVKQPTDLSRKTKLFQKMMYCANHENIDYRAVQLLTLSDRVQHNREVILPALAAGKTVISDRYLYTSVANMLARGYREENWFFDAAKGILLPDAVFLASVPPELALSRIRSRPEERNRHLDEGLLRGVHAEFLRMAQDNDFLVLDTSGDAELPFAAVRERLDDLLEERK